MKLFKCKKELELQFKVELEVEVKGNFNEGDKWIWMENEKGIYLLNNVLDDDCIIL